MQNIVSGMIYLYSGGKSLYGSTPPFYVTIGQKSLFGIPYLVIIMIIFAIVTYIILNKTLIGRYIYATGGNEKTARFSGISTKKYKYFGLMICAAFSAIAGILLAAGLGSGQPTAGDNFTMEAMSAVFVGMTTIRVGRANVMGTIVGVFLIGIISNGLNLLGWSFYFQDMAKGVIMIAAVAFAASRTELKFFK
jgi:ribose transport system permease protein